MDCHDHVVVSQWHNLLIHGARSVFTARVLRTKKLDKIEEANKSRFTDWMFKLQERRGYNTSVVASGK